MQFRSKLNTMLACICLFGSSQVLSDTPRLSLSVYGGKTQESVSVPVPAGVSVSTTGTEAFGLGVGYNFSDSLSLELEFIRGGIDIDASGPRGSIADETTIDTVAVYFTQRSEGDFFLKTKIGAVEEKLNFGEGIESSDTGLSYGIGFGYKLNQKFSFEAEYLRVEQDVAWLLVSGRYLFGW